MAFLRVASGVTPFFGGARSTLARRALEKAGMGDRLLLALATPRLLAYVFDFFAHKLPGLGAGRLTFIPVLLCPS